MEAAPPKEGRENVKHLMRAMIATGALALVAVGTGVPAQAKDI